MSAIEAEDFSTALRLVNRAISIEGREGLFYRLKAEALLAMKRNVEALDAANTAQQLSPDYVGIYLTRARVHRAMGRVESAKVDYQRSRELLPTSEAAEFLGSRLLREDPEVAKTLLAEASALGQPAGLDAQQALDRITLADNPADLLELNVVKLRDSDVLSLTNKSSIAVRHIRLSVGEGQRQFRVRGEFGPVFMP